MALSALFVVLQVAHYAEHRHWIGYGWHVDVVAGTENSEAVLWAKVSNVTFSPKSVRVCLLPNDISTPHVATSPLFDIERFNETTATWERAYPETRVECPAQAVSRTAQPLVSFDTRKAPIAVEGFKTTDRLRFAIYLDAESQKSGAPLLSAAFFLGDRCP